MMARRCQKFIFLILMHGWITVCSTFYDILKPRVGVYTDESGIASRLSEKVKLTVSQTIFLTVVNNNDDRQLLLNFECFTKRLGLKLMIIGSNASGFDSALASTPNSHYYYSFNQSHFSQNKFQIVDSSPEIAKAVVIFEILQLGYNVLFAKPDVIMIRDPFPYLLYHRMDVVFATNSKCTREGLRELLDEPVLVDDIDESFFFVRSNNRTIKLWNDTVQTYSFSNDSNHLSVLQKELAINTTLYTGACRDVTDEEQTLQHEESISEAFDIDFTLKDHQAVHIPTLFKEKRLSICSLNSCMFSSCMLPQYNELIRQLHARHLPSISIHANCINSTDDKKGLLQAAGLWMLRSNEGECEVKWLPQQHSYLTRNKRTKKRPAKLQQVSSDNNNIVQPGSNNTPPVETVIKPILEKSIQEVQSIQQALLLHYKRTKRTNKMLRDRSHHKQPRREVKDTTVLTKSKKYYDPDSKDKKSKLFQVLSVPMT
jgi:hypothetical protein